MEKPVMMKMIRAKERYTDGDGKLWMQGIFFITRLEDLHTKEPYAELTRVITSEGDGPLGEATKLPLRFVLERFERCELVAI